MPARFRSDQGRRVRFSACAIGAAFGVAALAAGCSGPSTPQPSPTVSASTPTRGDANTVHRQPSPSFAPDSVFAQDVRLAPLHPVSRGMIANLLGQVTTRYSGNAAFNTREYGISTYVADASTAVVTVAYDDCQDRGWTPPGLFDGPKYFEGVPIPADALPATGTDGAVSIWSPDTDRLWEFWRLSRRDDGGGWQACWGGRIDAVSRSTGQFPAPYGVSASGLASAGSLISVAEALDTQIGHALGLVIPAPARGKINYPANRQDGTSTARFALPEGTRLRLSATVRVETLGLTPVGTAIARAAQRYGFIVVDRGGAVGVIAETGLRASAPDNDPWAVVLGGQPTYTQLEGFPWGKLEVLAADWGKPG